MGGRGTYAKGNNVDFTYKTVGYIEGVKVSEGLNGKHSLPEESHSGSAYIKLENGIFKEMRIYDKDHYLIKEIAYHREKPLTGNNNEKVLHIHEYKRDNFKDRKPRKLTKEEIKEYRKYLIGVTKYD